MILVCIPGFFGGRQNTVSNDYGGAGYEEGRIAKVRETKPPQKTMDTYWSDKDFVENCGVFGRALRLANPQEIEACF